jgi:hypothetical protein
MIGGRRNRLREKTGTWSCRFMRGFTPRSCDTIRAWCLMLAFGPGRGCVQPGTPTSYRRLEKRDRVRSGLGVVGRDAARRASISGWSLWPMGVRASHSR